MASVKFFKKIMPIALAGAAALVMAMPISALAGDWNHHDRVARQAWLGRHQNWFNGWHRAAAPAYGTAYGYAPRAAIPAVPAYSAGVPAYATPYAGGAYGTGYGPCGNGGNGTRLQNVYRRDLATGHPLAANDVARQMQGNRCGGMASRAPYGGYAYGQNGSVFAPLMGSLMGVR
jgi:hypothetical protein